MNTVKIHWFSILAEKRNRRIELVSVSEQSTVQTLMDSLADDFPEFQKFRNYIRVAVNEQYADADTQLSEGDEVAFITPVSGG